MDSNLMRAHLFFTAGALAGLVQSLILWAVNAGGLLRLLGLPLSIPLTPYWLYQRVVWGGLWGLLFLVPLLRAHPQWQRGLLVGLAPAVASLFFFLPVKDGLGWLGLTMGPMLPVVVIAFNLLWGLLAGLWLGHLFGERPAEVQEELP